MTLSSRSIRTTPEKLFSSAAASTSSASVIARTVVARVAEPGCPHGLRSHPQNLIRFVPAKGEVELHATRFGMPPQAGFARRRHDNAWIGANKKEGGPRGNHGFLRANRRR